MKPPHGNLHKKPSCLTFDHGNGRLAMHIGFLSKADASR